MNLNLYMVRDNLSRGKKLSDLPFRVTFYARVSTDREEQLNSLENQVMYFENYIKSQTNWIFVPGYVDEGITGTTVKKRDNFLKMIDDSKNGMFNLILTKEISRFSRNTVDSIQYTRELLSYDVGVYFLNDNINTFEADSELRLTIMSSIAQDEIRKLSERVRFGYKRSVERGIVPGNNNFYGYKKNNGKLEIIEEEAKLIRLIFKEYSKAQMGTAKLGYYLYDKYNIVSKANKPLLGTVIVRIIRNPKYKGYFCAHKETAVDYHSKKKIRFKPDEWIVYKNPEACPPIVSEELWNKCNEILNSNTIRHRTHTRTDMRYALSGKIKCYYDGATFIRGNYKNKRTGEITRYWACSNYRKYGKQKINGCNTSVVHYDNLLYVFKIVVEKFIGDKNMLQETYDMINKTEYRSDLKCYTDDFDRKVDELEMAKKELINMLAKKKINDYEYSEQRKQYDDEISVIKKRKKISLKRNCLVNLSNINVFLETVRNVILNDDESIFRIFCSIIDTIFVEKTNSKDEKTILHFKLNVLASKECTLDLENFLLLFNNC